MAYTPNAVDATTPLDSTDASTAAAEFRALKAYVQSLVLTSGIQNTVRQAANDGAKDANGLAAYLTTPVASGLQIDLKASSAALVVNYAGGNSAAGQNDRLGQLTTDTANIVAGLAASNTSFIYSDYVSSGVWNWGKTLANPQIGYTYAKSQTLLQFGGSVGSTTFLDDFGNPWVAFGGAKIQTNKVKFGTGALGGGGASNALNGTTDYIASAYTFPITNAGWSIRGWITPSAVPGIGLNVGLIGLYANGFIGARLHINNAATAKFHAFISSNNSTNNIMDADGVTTPIVGTTYFVELTYDSLAGVYRLYVNGIQEASAATTNRVCGPILNAAVGSDNGVLFFNGYVDKVEILPYCDHPGGTTYSLPAAAPSALAVGYAQDFFDVQAYKMYGITAVSTVSGTAATLTQKYRLYHGEADTNAVTCLTVRNYQYNGKYISPDTTIPGFGVKTLFNANLGTTLLGNIKAYVRNYIAEAGYISGMISPILVTSAAGNVQGDPTFIEDRNNFAIMTGNAQNFNVTRRDTGAASVGITIANWKMFLIADRSY